MKTVYESYSELANEFMLRGYDDSKSTADLSVQESYEKGLDDFAKWLDSTVKRVGFEAEIL